MRKNKHDSKGKRLVANVEVEGSSPLSRSKFSPKTIHTSKRKPHPTGIPSSIPSRQTATDRDRPRQSDCRKIAGTPDLSPNWIPDALLETRFVRMRRP